MKNKKELLSVTKTVRITETQNQKLDKLGISIREAIEFTIAKRENPLEKMNERRREIESEIREHEKQIRELQYELNEIVAETGLEIEIRENENLDALMDAQKLINRYSHLNLNNGQKELDESEFNNFIELKQGKKYLDYLCAENGGNDKEKYRNEIIENAHQILKKQLK